MRTFAEAWPDEPILQQLAAKLPWGHHMVLLDETIIEIVISEAQNEVADFKKWDFDIIPHRVPDEAGVRCWKQRAGRCRKRLQEPEHPFRIAIVLRYVVDWLRRRNSVDPIHRQAYEGPHVNASHRAGEPRLS